MVFWGHILRRYQNVGYTVSNSGTIDELERVWKEVVHGLIGVLFLRLPGGTEENHEKRD
jgi:hypothetical protein